MKVENIRKQVIFPPPPGGFYGFLDIMKIILYFLTFSFLSLFNFQNLDATLPKTLVLIISSNNQPVYEEFQKIWRSYMHSDPDHFECYFIQSSGELLSDFEIRGDTIWCKKQGSIVPGVLNRTLLSLDCLGPRLSEFDYVLRTNLSSFYIFPRLLTFLAHSPKSDFYCGVHHVDPDHRCGWICGAGMLLSMDLVKMLMDHKPVLFDCVSSTDDVVIGDFFCEQGVKISLGRHYEIGGMNDWEKIRNHIPDDLFHFRIKVVDANRFQGDLSIQQSLLKNFYPP